MDAVLVSTIVNKKKNVPDIPYKAFKSFAELTLPYVYGKDKIKKMDDKEKDYWKKLLAQRKEEMETKNKK